LPSRLQKGFAALFVFGLVAVACSNGNNSGGPTTSAGGPTTSGGATSSAGGTTSGGGATSAPSKQYTIGFTNPIASNDQLHTLQQAIEARAEALGDKVISLNDNLDVNKQVSDIDQLVAQKVDAIIVFPLDPKAITPAVERAEAAGIKTIGINATLGNTSAKNAKPFDAAVNQGEEEMATGTAKFVIDQLHGKGNVLGIGLGVPVPTIEYQMQVMQDEVTKGGLTWLARVDNPTDDSAGAEPVVAQALLKYPDINAIMAYNDPSALGAVAAVKAAGDQGKIIITGANGVALDQVRDGEIALSYDLLPWVQGICYVNVITDILNGTQVPVTTTAPVQQITKDNVDQVQDWNAAIAKIKSGQYTKCAPADQQ
jgi:ribose transport system substrate-binding protein